MTKSFFVVVSAVLVLNKIVGRPGPALAGLGVIAAGVPVYGWIRFAGLRRPAAAAVPAGDTISAG